MKLLNIINELTVIDVSKSINFYNKYFQFEVEETAGNPITWVRMKKDNCLIMFESYEEVCKEIEHYPKKVETSNLIKFKYSDKDELFRLYNKLSNDNIEFFMQWKSTEYGSVEFGIFDPDKNLIILSS